MNGSDLGGPAATPGWARSPAPATAENAGVGRARPARAQKRVVLGDLTNIADGGFGAVDAVCLLARFETMAAVQSISLGMLCRVQ